MATLFEFRLEPGSGISTYLQLAQQVRRGVKAGRLRAGDQLPTIREVVANLGINPNTVVKAYRELERDGLVASRPGAGTFIEADARKARWVEAAGLRRRMAGWLADARAAGMDSEDIRALVDEGLRQSEGGMEAAQ